MRQQTLSLGKENFSETLEKGLNILSLFNEHRRGLTLTEISKASGVNKTSIYRYLNTYCRLGYLRKDPRTKVFKLGPRTMALALCFIEASDFVELIKPVVDQAHTRLGVHIDVGLLHLDSICLIYRRETEDTMRFRNFSTAKGLHFMATGKAAMAFLSNNERSALLDRLHLEKKTANTIVHKPKLVNELDRIRRRGYALSNEEYIPGLIAIGAPLINRHTAKVQGAISFDSSTARHSIAAFENEYAESIVELAKEISALLPPA